MRSSHRGIRLTPVALAAILLLPSVVAQGQIVQFEIDRFGDTLFASVDGAHRVAFDGRGHLWYASPAGVVHVDPVNHTRDLYTRVDGLPSSLALGLDVVGDKVYAGTDLGLAVIDVNTHRVTSYTTLNSPLPDAIVQDVSADGTDLWIGTYFGGVARLDTTTGEWTLHNTSTTASHPHPVRRITPGATAIWVATDGDGVWRHDRATGAWTVILREDGLATNDARVVLEGGRNLYVGSEKGLQVRRAYAPYAGTPDEWVTFNASNSALPDNHVMDLDVIPVQGGGVDVFASTRKGVWQYDGDTGNSKVLDQDFGILGSVVLDNEFTRWGWAFATTRGVSLQRGGEWSYFVTGPSSPKLASQGPGHFMFTSASVGTEGPILWFGAPDGIYGYRPATSDRPGEWHNRGPWSNYTGGPVNWIDTDGGVTWVASNSGVYGYRHDAQEWFERKVLNSRNLAYGLEADRGELWIALFGDGLIMRNLTTGQTRSWDATTSPPLPDLHLTDVRAQGNDVWIGSSVGVTRIDRATGELGTTYTRADGIPGKGVVFRVLPEGSAVWIATKSDGVARLDLDAGRVTHSWNATTHPGFPEGEVRALHREGNHLWVGTTDGLARVHTGTGAVKTWRTSDSDLVQNYVNGIASREGVLYLATLSGVARMDLDTEQFLPMQEGPDVKPRRDDAPRAPPPPSVRVTIHSPQHLALVSGVVQVTGSAQAVGGVVDRVEVQVGEGPWTPVEGTGSWSHAWDSATATPDQAIAIRARAFHGANVSRVAEILAIPVPSGASAVAVEALVPPSATAGRDLAIAARAVGDPPLEVRVYYRGEQQAGWRHVVLRADGALHRGVIPGADVPEGDLQFYVEARSGRHARTDPPEATAQPYVLNVSAAPRLSVRIEAPTLIETQAGAQTPIPFVVRNTGNAPVTLAMEVNAEGPAARWVRVEGAEVTLQPGESRALQATSAVEAGAYAQERVVTLRARDVTGVADPATAAFPLRIAAAPAAPDATDAPPRDDGQARTPGPSIPLFAAALAVAALALRRRSP